MDAVWSVGNIHDRVERTCIPTKGQKEGIRHSIIWRSPETFWNSDLVVFLGGKDASCVWDETSRRYCGKEVCELTKNTSHTDLAVALFWECKGDPKALVEVDVFFFPFCFIWLCIAYLFLGTLMNHNKHCFILKTDARYNAKNKSN